MKKYVLPFVLLLSLFAAAQQDQKLVTVPESMLSEQQKAELKARELQDKAQRYGNWIGIGHELGTAVNESLSAISTQANAFAQTPVGKWTMFLVIFKIAGVQLMQFTLGTLMFVVGTCIWLWSYRRFLPRRFIVRETVDPSDPKKVEREYAYGFGCRTKDKYGDAKDAELASNWLIGHWFILALFLGATMGVIFAG